MSVCERIPSHGEKTLAVNRKLGNNVRCADCNRTRMGLVMRIKSNPDESAEERRMLAVFKSAANGTDISGAMEVEHRWGEMKADHERREISARAPRDNDDPVEEVVARRSTPVDYSADSSTLRDRVFNSTRGGAERTRAVTTRVRAVDQDALRQATLIDYAPDNVRRHGRPLAENEGFSFISGQRDVLHQIEIDHVVGVATSDEPVDVVPLTRYEHQEKTYRKLILEHIIVDGKKVGIHVTLCDERLKKVNFLGAREGKSIMFPPEVLARQAEYEWKTEVCV